MGWASASPLCFECCPLYSDRIRSLRKCFLESYFSRGFYLANQPQDRCSVLRSDLLIRPGFQRRVFDVLLTL